MSSSSVWQSLVALTIMIAIGYGARVLGLVIMARMPIGPNMRLFVDAMSSSVIIAILTPMIVLGDGGTKFAAIMAAGVALFLRSPFASIAVGIVGASGWRWFWS